MRETPLQMDRSESDDSLSPRSSPFGAKGTCSDNTLFLKVGREDRMTINMGIMQ